MPNRIGFFAAITHLMRSKGVQAHAHQPGGIMIQGGEPSLHEISTGQRHEPDQENDNDG